MRQGEKRGSEERNIAKLHSCGNLCWKGLIVKNNTTKVFKCVKGSLELACPVF